MPQVTVAAAAPAAASGGDDVLAQLERLGALRAAGVLTDDEFATAKATLLGR
ncbi:SHOCT domain-containing protein [Gulosibacter macacae]|uniref:SHOCT domain-containing protein n=2 Tax=Gulosibacter macacae TaxID=2488791 RepID=A0A3P3VWW7_9MICO|nr:SHOCT domain-containing protein [Gulosibacter macacae]